MPESPWKRIVAAGALALAAGWLAAYHNPTDRIEHHVDSDFARAEQIAMRASSALQNRTPTPPALRRMHA